LKWGDRSSRLMLGTEEASSMTENVKEIMTKKLITVNLADSVRKAYQIMQDNRIRHLPVVDQCENIVGILSDRDLQRAMKPKKGVSFSDESTIEFDPKFNAEDFMSWPVKTVSQDTTIYEVTRTMLKEKMSAIVVLGEHCRPRGIVTTDDLLRFLLSLLEKDPPNLRLKLNAIFEDFVQSGYMI